ncbi:substrate-binding domain-containing protein [Aestuariicoccus sp. KMU-90]|uniref:Substrate-binding domain-containing protein n=2 Tax=Thetidibacter halocola TaxID=2827239 RepID=A0A8J7WKW6_9RHOB|nr:substrate-binding domain-containing protein [Thetidibacter halocola]
MLWVGDLTYAATWQGFLQPGRDVSVIGLDGIEDAGGATPPLTTMGVSPLELGRKLARTLLNRIEDPNMPPTVFELTAGLVTSDTTGAAPLPKRQLVLGHSRRSCRTRVRVGLGAGDLRQIDWSIERKLRSRSRPLALDPRRTVRQV